MVQPQQTQTRKLREIELPTDAEGQADLSIDIGVPSKIALVIKHMQVKLIFPVVEPMILGRSRSEGDGNSFIDLQHFGADDLGVSRKHMRLWSENGELFVEDLASLNHSRLNNIILDPQTPQRIRHGDQIALGGLELKVEFIFDFLA